MPGSQDQLFSDEARGDDAELNLVADCLLSADPDGGRTAGAIRRTYDMLLDGQHTGRYRWDQLHKTEKTHFGTLLEINLQREFGFADGDAMDFAICGIDVDCKYSQTRANWMIPPEAFGHLLLGLWASDEQGRWSAGLIRATDDVLSTSRGNRDRKKQLSGSGRQRVVWLFDGMPLPENVLLHIPGRDVEEIFAQRSGAKRIDALLRLAQGRIIRRNVIATVGKQDDYMKRLRANGGARTRLRKEGIVVLGQYRNHVLVAEKLGLPVPGRGETVSIRLAQRQAHHGDAAYITLEGQQWVVALPGDPAELAPKLPDI